MRDLAFGGSDIFTNLWPLDSGINQRGLGYTRDYRVKFHDGKDVAEKNLMSMDGKWFCIAGFGNSVPSKPGGKGRCP